ncbi:hypothetical protein D3C71_2167620 [compost metagenome]
MKLELVFRKRRPEICPYGDPVAHASVECGVIGAHLKPASGLRRIHGRIGMTQQVFG